MSIWKDKSRFRGGGAKTPRLDDIIPIAKFASGVFNNYRFIGPAYTFAEHWIEIETKSGKTVKIRKLCSAYDPTTGEFSGKCAYCDLNADTPRVVTLQNAINRDLQKREPRNLPPHLPSEKKLQRLFGGGKDETFYLKERGSESWTPVEPLKLSTSPCQRIADYAALNKRKTKSGMEVFGPEDPDYGFDLTIKYEDGVAPANAYFVDKGSKTVLEEDEMDYLLYRLDVERPEEPHVQAKEAESLSNKLVGGTEDDSGKRDDRLSSGSSRRGGYLDDMDDDPGDDEELPARGRSRSRDDDEPRGRSTGRDDRRRDDEYDEPPARSRSRDRDDDDDPPRGRARSRDDDDDPPRRRVSSDDDRRSSSRDDRGRRSSSRRRNDEDDDAPRTRERSRDSRRRDLDL